jgi:hypothetical protein
VIRHDLKRPSRMSSLKILLTTPDFQGTMLA